MPRKSALPVTNTWLAQGLAVLALFVLLALPTPLRANTGEAPTRPPASTNHSLFAALWRGSAPLVTLHQGPGQSEQDFLLEVAAAVDALTDAVAAEVCGVFELDDPSMRLVITLMTQGSPAYCLNPAPSVVGAEGRLRGASIHSHVDAGPRVWRSLGGARPAGARFTAMDYAAGAGYLVHRGRLWHQRGLGTQRHIARLDAASTPPEARLAARALMGEIRACA